MEPTHVCRWCMQKSNYYAKLDDDHQGNFCENIECLTIQILSGRKNKRADSVENFCRKMKETDLNDEIKGLKDEIAQLREHYTERTVYIEVKEKKQRIDGSLSEPNVDYQVKKPRLVSVVQEIMTGVVIEDPFEANE